MSSDDEMPALNTEKQDKTHFVLNVDTILRRDDDDHPDMATDLSPESRERRLKKILAGELIPVTVLVCQLCDNTPFCPQRSDQIYCAICEVAVNRCELALRGERVPVEYSWFCHFSPILKKWRPELQLSFDPVEGLLIASLTGKNIKSANKS